MQNNRLLITIFEAFILFWSVISPICLVLIPIAWNYHDTFKTPATSRYRVLCETKLLTWCIKYLVLLFMSSVIYHRRLNVCSHPVRSGLPPAASLGTNGAIYLLLDFMLCSIIISHWSLSILRWVEMKLNRKPLAVVNTGRDESNPFLATYRPSIPSSTETFEFSLNMSSGLLNMELLIFIAGALLIKAWGACGAFYVVRIFRSTDGLCGTLRVKEAYVSTIVKAVIEYLELIPSQNVGLSKQSHHSYRTCPLYNDTLTTPNCMQRNNSDCYSISSHATSRASKRKLGKMDGALQRSNNLNIPGSGKFIQQSVNPSRNDSCSDIFGDWACCSSVRERLHIQSRYEKMLRRKRIRLLLLTESWFKEARKRQREVPDQNTEALVQLVMNNTWKPLCKYLCLTGQCQYHGKDQIQSRLKLYLCWNMSAQAFLNVYLEVTLHLTEHAVSEDILAGSTHEWAVQFLREKFTKEELPQLQTKIRDRMRFLIIQQGMTVFCHVNRASTCKLLPTNEETSSTSEVVVQCVNDTLEHSEKYGEIIL